MVRATKILPIALVMAAGALAAPAFGQTYGTPPTPPMPPGATGGMTSQSYSDATMTKAGHALHDVLTINQSYRQKMMGTSDMNARHQMATEAQQQAGAAVTRDGLTVDQYNQILTQARQDPALRARLLNAAGLPASTQ